MAQNGHDAGKPFDELRSIRSAISRPYRRLVRLLDTCRRQHRGSDAELEPKLQSICKDVELAKDPDAIIEQANQIVKAMESICKDIIRGNEFRSLWQGIEGILGLGKKGSKKAEPVPEGQEDHQN